MKNYIKILLMLVIMPASLFAQGDAQISQHLITKTHYNPSVTGDSKYGNITLVGRHQFLGFTGAPATALLNFDMLIPGSNSGIGLSVDYDRYGPIISYNAVFNYAYHLKTGEGQKLSFGLGGGVAVRQYDASGNIYENVGDPNENYDEDLYIRPTFNFGLQYRLKNWTIGASITNIQSYFYEQDLRFSNVNYYFYTDYKFELGHFWDITPSIAVHYDNVIVNEEVGIKVNYSKVFWVGFAYRMNDVFLPESIVPSIGFNITDYVRLGYAYDYNVSSLNKYNTGTHELLLQVRFRTKMGTNKTPRNSEW